MSIVHTHLKSHKSPCWLRHFSVKSGKKQSINDIFHSPFSTKMRRQRTVLSDSTKSKKTLLSVSLLQSGVERERELSRTQQLLLQHWSKAVCGTVPLVNRAWKRWNEFGLLQTISQKSLSKTNECNLYLKELMSKNDCQNCVFLFQHAQTKITFEDLFKHLKWSLVQLLSAIAKEVSAEDRL